MDVKWIKIATGVFENRKILQIESLPDKDTIIVIWFKLLCLAGTINDDGLLYFTKDIPYTEEMLSNQFHRPMATVQMALGVFKQFGMIEDLNGVLRISNWEKYQSAGGLEKIKEQNRIRQRAWKEKRKALPNHEPNDEITLGNVTDNVTDNVTVTHGNATDIDIENKNKNKKENKNKNKISLLDTITPNDINVCVDAWNRLGLSQIKSVTEPKNLAKNLTERIKENGVDRMIEIIESIKRSPFLMGQNNSRWVVTLEWVVREDNFRKIAEGKYLDRKNDPPADEEMAKYVKELKNRDRK